MGFPAMLSILRKLLRPRGADWHRAGIGGQWDVIGRLQFEFLLAQGLQPAHRLLDVGCGSLRGGVHFIQYLDPGNYVGLEKEPELLEAAVNVELPRYGIADRRPTLIQSDVFDLASLPPDMRFEFALAQSVFTHLLPAQIEACVRAVAPRLAQGGVFFATYSPCAGNSQRGLPHAWRANERTLARYAPGFFSELSDRLGLAFEHIGDWRHPRGQQMLAFRRSAARSTAAA